ncbi:hypothetical protein G7047_00500 [Diaphorobacter sp. HDW4A]|uniref:hypothetical protein n=1 Tax=Diaphorobacter sp. HDW4A TaxID=2714924 RepID=UPI00140D2166|nr:hypothetical protein [Diaphorobacter sp. HDW4A]QIL78567.1 hypothetical protein G7047_00500 [Diaphorobacter sp. HDW4A]
MKIKHGNYSRALASNGRLGGLARGKKYENKRRQSQELYIANIKITIKEIAEKVGVSIGFVSDCTKSQFMKSLRYSQKFTIQDLLKLNDEQFQALTLQDDILQDLAKMERIKKSDDYKQLKRDKLLKF